MIYSDLLCYDNECFQFVICEDDIYNRDLVNRILNYEDVTSDWINFACLGDCKVIDAKYFEDANKNRYFVDGKNVVLDYSDTERAVAEWLVKTFGGDVYMLPRVNKPDGISTSDYLFMNEKWDLKEINGNGKNSLDNAIKNKRKQSVNFIFDFSQSSLSEQEIIHQIIGIYNNSKRKWIQSIILKKNDMLIKIFIRK